MITDVVLRGRGHPEVVRKVKELRPEMAILFNTGYRLGQS